MAGHSAGGQLVQRYAAYNSIEHELATPRGVEMRYLVSAPSSYAYLSAHRPVPGTTASFEIPSSPPNDYNEWGFGLEDLYSRIEGTTFAGQIQDRYPERRVRYIIGSLDNDPDHASLGTSEEAMLQGQHRLERMPGFFNHLQFFYGEEITQRQDFFVIEDVGHATRATFSSDPGRGFFFGGM